MIIIKALSIKKLQLIHIYIYIYIYNKVLERAAKGGKWKPDLLLISNLITPWILEMILVLPDALYYAIAHALGLLPHPYLISPGQMDLMEGRRSMVHWHYKTFFEVSSISLCHQYQHYYS